MNYLVNTLSVDELIPPAGIGKLVAVIETIDNLRIQNLFENCSKVTVSPAFAEGKIKSFNAIGINLNTIPHIVKEKTLEDLESGDVVFCIPDEGPSYSVVIF